MAIGEVSTIEHEDDSGCTFFQSAWTVERFLHLEQEWTRLRYRPGGLLLGEGISFCGGDGGLIGGIAIAGGLDWSWRVAMEDERGNTYIPAGRSPRTRGNRRESRSLGLARAGAVDTERDWPGLWGMSPQSHISGRGQWPCS